MNPAALQRCAFAKQVVKGVRNPQLGVTRAAWGYLIHTTGGGVTDKAKRQGRSPIEVALEIYVASQNGSNGYMWGGPSYVGDFDGTIYQIAPDDVKTAHAGDRSDRYPSGTRPLYLDGSWERLASTTTVDQWRAKWPGRKHPYALFPSTSPNQDYVAIEFLPIGDGFGGEPMAPGLRFTQAQHDAAIKLGRDLAARHDWPEGWHKSGRLVGHEDVDPLHRSDHEGGWDPGWLRAKPYFDFAYVRAGMATAPAPAVS